MGFEPSRLRRGEVVAGAGALALLVFMFALPWYRLSGGAGRTAATLGVSASVNGWNGLTNLRWLMLVTILVTLALVFLQGARPAPALPASFSVIATVLGILTTLALIDRVVISVPGPSQVISARIGAYLGLLSTLVLTYGAFRSLREEGRPDSARNASIPIVHID